MRAVSVNDANGLPYAALAARKDKLVGACDQQAGKRSFQRKNESLYKQYSAF